MVYSLTYRRPGHISRPGSMDGASVTSETKQRSIRESVHSSNSGLSRGIPEALSFDRIIAGGVCPVSTESCEWPSSLHI